MGHNQKQVWNLCGCNENLSILGCAEIVHDAHELAGLSLGLLGLWHMQVHLVPIKVCIVGAAHALVEAERPAAFRPITLVQAMKVKSCFVG